MGRQSSRIYFQGKDHKDIYFRGHYHDKMYIGSQLVWEKIKEDLSLNFSQNIFSTYKFYDRLTVVNNMKNVMCWIADTINKKAGYVIFDENGNISDEGKEMNFDKVGSASEVDGLGFVFPYYYISSISYSYWYSFEYLQKEFKTLSLSERTLVEPHNAVCLSNGKVFYGYISGNYSYAWRDLNSEQADSVKLVNKSDGEYIYYAFCTDRLSRDGLFCIRSIDNISQVAELEYDSGITGTKNVLFENDTICNSILKVVNNKIFFVLKDEDEFILKLIDLSNYESIEIRTEYQAFENDFLDIGYISNSDKYIVFLQDIFFVLTEKGTLESGKYYFDDDYISFSDVKILNNVIFGVKADGAIYITTYE